MSFSSFRGIILTLLVLAGLWVLFLIAAHLILDFEQGRLYFESLSFTQIGNTRKDSIDDTLYFERTEGKKSPYLIILSQIEHNNYIIFNARPVLLGLIQVVLLQNIVSFKFNNIYHVYFKVYLLTREINFKIQKANNSTQSIL